MKENGWYMEQRSWRNDEPWLRLNPIEADATTLESAPPGTYAMFYLRPV